MFIPIFTFCRLRLMFAKAKTTLNACLIFSAENIVTDVVKKVLPRKHNSFIDNNFLRTVILI